MEENEVVISGTSIAIVFTSSRYCQENGSIMSRQRRGNVVKSKMARVSLQAKKSRCKAKRVYAKYPIDNKKKRKLEHKWGPHVYENYLGKKRNKFEKFQSK